MLVAVQQRSGVGLGVVHVDLDAGVLRGAPAVGATGEGALKDLADLLHRQHRAVGRRGLQILQRGTEPAEAEDKERHDAGDDEKQAEPDALVLGFRVLVSHPELRHRPPLQAAGALPPPPPAPGAEPDCLGREEPPPPPPRDSRGVGGEGESARTKGPRPATPPAAAAPPPPPQPRRQPGPGGSRCDRCFRASCTLGREERTGGSCLQRPLPASAPALSPPPPPRLLSPGVSRSPSPARRFSAGSPASCPEGRRGWAGPSPGAPPCGRRLRPAPPAADSGLPAPPAPGTSPVGEGRASTGKSGGWLLRSSLNPPWRNA